MTHVITENQNGTTTIQVDFADEGVDLQGKTLVKGGEAAALSYLRIFEKDLRRNFAEKFPLPEPEETEEEMI
ncbi:MAG: hypothetical protein QM343_01600 [Bacillota bacterium]|jgi:hypothetical protein|nr:hypothetical protein [Bacillota bacterium]